MSDYRERFGAQAIAIPADEGLDRALWALPVAAIFLAAVGLIYRARTWVRQGSEATDAAADEADDGLEAEYDDQLEDELRRLEGE